MYEILVNPGAHSGRGIELFKKVESVFKEKKVDYHVNYTNHFTENDTVIPDLYNEYKSKGEVLHLIVMGGDGTVNGVLQKLPAFDNLKLSVIPLGSGNDLVRDLDIKGNIRNITRHLLETPITRRIDIGNIHCENKENPEEGTDLRFIVSAGIGYDAAVCEEAMRSPVKNILNKLGLGKLIYLVVALKQLAGVKYIEGTLTIDSVSYSLKQFLLAAAMNHRYEGGGFMFGPEAKDDDGMLEICTVSEVSRLRALRILPTAFSGRHFRFDGVNHYRTGELEFKSDTPLWVHTDGEVRTQADYIKITTDRQILEFEY